MKTCMRHDPRYPLRPTLLALALSMASVGSASAGEICHMLSGPDTNGNTVNVERAAFACGTANHADAAGSQAFGNRNNALGYLSGAFGIDNTALGRSSSAFGNSNSANGLQSIAFGSDSLAQGDYSFAAGASTEDLSLVAPDLDLDRNGTNESYSQATTAWGYGSVAVGAASRALGRESVVLGFGNAAATQHSSAVGVSNTANGLFSSAVGYTNTTLGQGDAAFGNGNSTGNSAVFGFSGNNVAVGNGNGATGGHYLSLGGPKYSSAALGADNQASGGNSSALGIANMASGTFSSAMGYGSLASANGSLAIGSWFDADGDGAVDAGEVAEASALNATALGQGARALAVDGLALGRSASVTADGAVAIGADAVAGRANSVAFGNDGLQRQLVQVAAGTEESDAVNLSQLHPVATSLGGGAGYAGGVFTAPVYVIQNNNYNNVGAAFAAVDGAIDDINDRIVAVGGIQGEQGESAYEVAVGNGFAGSESDWLDSLRGAEGPAGPDGPEGPAGGGPRSVVYDSDERDVLTLAGSNGTRIANVDDALDATDAVNLGQMQTGDAATLASARNYADAGDATTLTAANEYTDQRFAEITGLSDSFETFRNETDRRFQQQDRRIDKLSAMSGAYAGMAMNTAGLAGRNRVGVGVGAQGGEQALAVGYQRAVGNRASVSIAGAFSGGEKSVSAGAGFSW